VFFFGRKQTLLAVLGQNVLLKGMEEGIESGASHITKGNKHLYEPFIELQETTPRRISGIVAS
jgi:hypothetical protein